MSDEKIAVMLDRETVDHIIGGSGSVKGYSSVDRNADLVSACRASVRLLEADKAAEEECPHPECEDHGVFKYCARSDCARIYGYPAAAKGNVDA